MHETEVLIEKEKTRGTLAVGLNKKGANGLGKIVWDGIFGNERHDILQRWKIVDIHRLP